MDHQRLLDCVYDTNIPATIRRWIHNYMQNAQAKVHFWQQESKCRKVKTGVVHRWIPVSSALQLLSDQLSNIAAEHQADQVRQ